MTRSSSARARGPIVHIVGARPNFMKLAPVHAALAGRCHQQVLHTGQHYDRELSGRNGYLERGGLQEGIDGREPVHWREFGVPLLVAEVLSPSTARYDRLVKRRLYQRCGVPSYWVVDLDARLFEVWRPGADSPLIASDQVAWGPTSELDPLVIDLAGYFGEVCGGNTSA